MRRGVNTRPCQHNRLLLAQQRPREVSQKQTPFCAKPLAKRVKLLGLLLHCFIVMSEPNMLIMVTYSRYSSTKSMTTPNARSSSTIYSRLCKSAVSCISFIEVSFFIKIFEGIVRESGVCWTSHLHIPGPDVVGFDGLLTQPAKCFWAHSNYVNWINFSALWRLILKSAASSKGSH